MIIFTNILLSAMKGFDRGLWFYANQNSSDNANWNLSDAFSGDFIDFNELSDGIYSSFQPIEGADNLYTRTKDHWLAYDLS